MSKKKKEMEPEIEVTLEEYGDEHHVPMPIVITLYGDLDEEKAEEVITELYSTIELYKSVELEGELEEGEEKPEVHLVLSTFGGSVHDMFSIYDCLQELKKYCVVSVLGLGKVQSAGVGLLCAGTKGKRKIGPHCRLMLHPVSFGAHGTLDVVEIERKETKQMSEMYQKILLENTTMTATEIKSYMKKDRNYYFGADEAIKKGIADMLVG